MHRQEYFYFHNKTQESASSKLLMGITGDGNVGIGTETPTTILEIIGDVVITNPYNTTTTLSIGDNGLNDTTTQSYGLVNLTRLADDYERAHLEFIKTSNFVWQMGFLNGSNSFGIFNNNYSSSLGASPVMSFTEGGNVGIGKPIPTTSLDVIGDIKASDSIISPYFYAQKKPNLSTHSLDYGSYLCWNSSNGGGETNLINVMESSSFGGFTFQQNYRATRQAQI